jgi:hypothetical protein
MFENKSLTENLNNAFDDMNAENFLTPIPYVNKVILENVKKEAIARNTRDTFKPLGTDLKTEVIKDTDTRKTNLPEFVVMAKKKKKNFTFIYIGIVVILILIGMKYANK